MALDFAALRAQLARLDWGRGLTRDGIRLRLGQLPEELYMHLPSEKRFRSADEVVLFLQHAMRWAASREPQEEEALEQEALEEGGPGGWGDSPTGETVVTPDLGHGVGSGAHPGYTGGGSAQTGVGREGTTYGDEESSPLPEGRS